MGTGKKVTASGIRELLKTQEYRCYLSGRELTPSTASLDHRVPISKGGAHDIDNLGVVDYHVNIAKGTLTIDEFISMCRDVVRHQDARQ
jgi:5-methylcytosine-specific restriction endonuclease McrA